MVVITYTYDQVREEDLIHCNVCKTQVGFVEDHLDIVQNGRTGVFKSVFNVKLLDSANYLRHVNGNTVADVYCVRCGMLLGLKLITVPRPSLEISEGRFLMNLDKLVYWNGYPMIYQEQDGSATDIDQALHELGEGAVVRLVPSEQNGRANVGPAPMDQDGGVVDQLADGLGNLDLNLRM
ncbi:protein yippee-like At3g08990 [Solanum dulcamara]|uniref:protein yippee-like At3g08990 n=1 Tax=Solanum dulcamara TaxID=45834 RepID=UPI0024863363|nr:protein yippee-like At3g08990 [Solanum dulcamara]